MAERNLNNCSPVPNELHVITMEGVLASAEEILDYSYDENGKRQNAINTEVKQDISEIDNRVGAAEGKINQNIGTLQELSNDLGELTVDTEDNFTNVNADITDKDTEVRGLISDVSDAVETVAANLQTAITDAAFVAGAVVLDQTPTSGHTQNCLSSDGAFNALATKVDAVNPGSEVPIPEFNPMKTVWTTEQNLSVEEQEQARKNIGLEDGIITDEQFKTGYYSLVKSGSGASTVFYEVGDKYINTGIKGTNSTSPSPYKCCVLEVKKDSIIEVVGQNESYASRMCVVVEKDTGVITYISNSYDQITKETIRPIADSYVYITAYININSEHPEYNVRAHITTLNSITTSFADSEVSPLEYALVVCTDTNTGTKSPEMVRESSTSGSFTLPQGVSIVFRNFYYVIPSDLTLTLSGYGVFIIIFDSYTKTLYGKTANSSIVLSKNDIPIALIRWDDGVYIGNFREYKYNGNTRRILINRDVDTYPTLESQNLTISNGVYNAIVKNTNGIFCIRHTRTISDGTLETTPNHYYNCTPYINIDYIKDNAPTECYISSVMKIQAFDADKNFLGLYNDFSDITATQRVVFNFDKTRLPANTQYIRMSSLEGTGFIDGVPFNTNYIVDDSEYVICTNEAHKRYARGFTKIKLNDNYDNYDLVTVNRIPTIEHVLEAEFVFYCWKLNTDNELVDVKEIRISGTRGKLLGHKFYYTDYYNELEYDYDRDGMNKEIVDPGTQIPTGSTWARTDATVLHLTKKAFTNPVSTYITPARTNIANSFKNLKYTITDTDYLNLTVTLQRFPNKSVLSNPGATGRYFCFYTWKNGVKKDTIYCYLSNAEISGYVVNYNRNGVEFTVDYSDCTENDEYGDSRYSGMELLPKAFNIISNPIQRGDLTDKQYVNLSSSTFSFGWHQQCVEGLGMVYNHYGIGGASHRALVQSWSAKYTDAQGNDHWVTQNPAKFNLGYKESSVENANYSDRNTLNMVAKLCWDYADTGFYPDIIVSCCVLNDCYGWQVAPTDPKQYQHYVIGTAEEAINTTLPILRTDTKEHIEEDFANFFNVLPSPEITTEGQKIVDIKSNSMCMMKLVIELLSERFPYSQIIISSCQQTNTDSFKQSAIDQFNREQEKLCKHYAIPYIKLNEECGINALTIPTFLMEDGVHPNTAGQILYRKYMTEQLKQKITLKR